MTRQFGDGLHAGVLPQDHLVVRVAMGGHQLGAVLGPGHVADLWKIMEIKKNKN